MAPIKSSLARTVGKLLGVSKDTDLTLRGDVQSTREKVAFSISGGTITDGVAPGDGYKYHAFVSDGNLTVTGSGTVDFLVIGGGGGAGAGDPGNNASAGSGAGGVARGLDVPISGGTIPITVGQGGAGAPAPRSSQASNGGDSKFGAPGESWYALARGGGYGSSQSSGGDYPGGSGGSGGGGANSPGSGNFGPATQPGTNPSPLITDYGNQGGNGSVNPGGWGGGGGAGSNGGDYSGGEGGDGGHGTPFPQFTAPNVQPLIPSPIRPTWTPVVGPTGMYAGGGGGGVYSGSGTPSGGPGGGGDEDTQGIDYTGSGSGGSPHDAGAGHRGAHGIVIIRHSL
tara:strand:+ start:30 stop:1049 length:1020 start_codon:yes stop_codon:yes gene_type:complete